MPSSSGASLKHDDVISFAIAAGALCVAKLESKLTRILAKIFGRRYSNIGLYELKRMGVRVG